MSQAVRTTCPYCGVGCGVLAQRDASGTIQVRGDPDHPANRGRLCSKGTALAATLDHAGRLLSPEIDGRQATWQSALDHAASGLAACIDKYGRDSVAFYVSGQMLTEDYYVANKLMKGYIGTANIDTNSRLCMSSAVAGHQRAFGEDLVPVCYEDLEQADLIVLVGSNTAWCHPVLMQRIVQARELRPELQVVVIDPRRTATCEYADLHLSLRSGTDVLLFNGLLAWLDDHACTDTGFVGSHTAGVESALAAARVACLDVAATAQACGLDVAALQVFFEMFARNARVVTAFSQGVNQSSSGSDKVNSIINCHLLTGRIGKPGAGPFSITGQPNAMGGREVGGLSTQLAAHLQLEEPAHRQAVQTFWHSPRIADRPGLKAVDLFDAIDAGRIRAVWIMATNPVVSLPDADMARRALERCALVIVSDCVARTDTTRLAHVLFPAAGWGEKDGTVTNSDRHVSRQRAFVPEAGEARPDWWIVCEIARRLGFGDGFDFDSAAAIFAEHARLSQVAAGFGRRFDLGGLMNLGPDEYAALAPRQWPTTSAADPGETRLFADGVFPTPDGRARFVATPPRSPRHSTTAEFPLVLNTGRVRDQWHTMTRTGRAPQLNAHEPEPYVDLHENDAQAAGIEAGALTRVFTRWGSMRARARCSGDMPAGMAFVPIHWNDQYACDARVGALVNPVVDPLSGEPEFKHTPARVEPLRSAWYGFVLSRRPLDPPEQSWWALARGAQFLRYEMASESAARPDGAWLRLACDAEHADADLIEYEDPGTGIYRGALLDAGRLQTVVFVASRPVRLARSWLAALFAQDELSDRDRADLLHGRPGDASADAGAMVCACFAVGATSITRAAQQGCETVGEIGQRLRAGTNCGSCRPEIARLLTPTRRR